MSSKAIFFDRDNTLIIDKNYMHKVSDLKFYSDIFSALSSIQNLGYKLFIVTNQSGIGRGYFQVEDMNTFHQALLAELTNHNIEIADIAFCPHSPEDKCNCRKPHPKMILDLAQKHQLDLAQSFMIGDKVIDGECGKAAGCTGILLNTKKQHDSKEFKSFNSLTDFANYLKELV